MKIESFLTDGVVLTLTSSGMPEYSHSIDTGFGMVYDSQSPVIQTSSGATYAVCSGKTVNKMLVKIT